MITKGVIQAGCTYLVPDAENCYTDPNVESLYWGADTVDVSIFRHIGTYPSSEEGMQLAELHLAIVVGLSPDAPSTTQWRRPSPSENTLVFRKWIDDYDLGS